MTSRVSWVWLPHAVTQQQAIPELPHRSLEGAGSLAEGVLVSSEGHAGEVSWTSRRRPSRPRHDESEHVAFLPVVVPERELVEVQRQVVAGDFVEGTHDPALELRPEAVNVGRVDVAPDVLLPPVIHGGMRESDSLVVLMLVRCHQLDLLRDGRADEADHRFFLGVLDYLGNDVALASDGTDYDSLPGSSAPALVHFLATADTAPVPVLGLPANVRLVNLDHAGQLLELGALHRGPDTVAHVPGGAVGTCADHPLDLEGADSFLALAHEVDHLEPRAEINIGVLEDRADERRKPVGFGRAFLADPVPGASQAVHPLIPATWAADAVRPPHLHKVLAAGILGGEPFHECSQGHHTYNISPERPGVKCGIIAFVLPGGSVAARRLLAPARGAPRLLRLRPGSAFGTGDPSVSA